MGSRAKWVVAAVLISMCFQILPARAGDMFEQGKVLWMISPLIGADRNELDGRDSQGQPTTQTDTAMTYGLYLMAIHPNFVINNFLFGTDVNDTEVWGNLFYANYYHDAESVATWNVGAGFLYHEIKPEGMTIEVKVPMVKAGPLFRIPSWHMRVNPYVGYAWEQVDTTHGDQDNNSYLYGLTLSWQWRMMGGSFKYYYQDSQDIEENFNNYHLRFHCGVTKNWGGVIRYNYMEHSVSKDQLLLAGPYFMF